MNAKIKSEALAILVGLLLTSLGCSGESASLGDSSQNDRGMSQDAMTDMGAGSDLAISQPDDMSIAADMNEIVDRSVHDAQPQTDIFVTDVQVPEDLGIVDAELTLPDQMVDAAVAPWMPRITPEMPILQDTGNSLELLIVGNNYVGLNALCDKISRLSEALNRWDSVTCELVSVGGYRLIDHADSAASGGELDLLLNEQDPTRIQFDLLILQERAQVSGFPDGQSYRVDFEQAAEELSIRANRLGMRTALLMPWARPGGDLSNVGLYPDFPTMQARIADAHYAVANESSGAGNQVAVIEAGEVWYRTFERNTNQDFTALYLPGDHHPSDTGTWLLAAVIMQRALGIDPSDLPQVSGLPEPNRWLRLRGDIIQQE